MKPIPCLWDVLWHCALFTKGYQGGHVLWYWYHFYRRTYYHCCGFLPLWIYFLVLGTGYVLIAAVIVGIHFCTPLIIMATSRFCSGLSLLVVNGAVTLVVLIIFLCRSFTACALSESFYVRCLLLQISRNHYSLPYYMLGLIILTQFSLWFPFILPCPPRCP